MKKPDPRALQLACVRCGLNVEIFKSESRYICKHCGTLQIIDRTSGVSVLRAYHESGLSELEPGAFDPNDDLSRARHELLGADAKRHQRAQHWAAFRQNRVDEWDAKSVLAKKGVKKLMKTTAVIVLVPATMVGWASFSVCKAYFATPGAIGAAGLLVLGFCATALAITREMLKSSDKYGFEKFEKQAADEFAIMDPRIAREADEAAKQVAALEEKVRQLELHQRVKQPPPEALPSDYGQLVLEPDRP